MIPGSKFGWLWQCGMLIFLWFVSCSDWNPSRHDELDPPATSPTPTPAANQQAAQLPFAKAQISNLSQILEATRALKFSGPSRLERNLKIAVLDNGFAGLGDSLAKRLPPDTVVYQGGSIEQQETAHGTKMLELVYAVVTGSPSYDASSSGPTLYPMITRGYTNLTKAIDRAIELEVDIVIYAQVWEFGGNFDGSGFLNQEINRATSRGILWFNAAGNYGNAVYGSPISFRSDRRTVALPHQEKYVRFEIGLDQTPVKITLAWNDFKDTKDYRTAKDLDLFLLSSDEKPLQDSRLIQDGRFHSVDEAAYSAHAREVIETVLDKGTYLLRVDSAHPEDFTSSDHLRLAILADYVRVLDNSKEPSVMIPGDNASVITVGAYDSSQSSSGLTLSNGLKKPEIETWSQVIFDTGEQVAGTSTATAIAAGVVGRYINVNGLKSAAEIRSLLKNKSIDLGKH